FRKLIRDEKLVTIENHLAVHQSSSIGRHHLVTFRAAENRFVKLHGGEAVANNQVRNELIFLHCYSLAVFIQKSGAASRCQFVDRRPTEIRAFQPPGSSSYGKTRGLVCCFPKRPSKLSDGPPVSRHQ